MTYDVHAHCIPKAFRDWLAKRGPALGASIVEVNGGQALDFAGKVTTGTQFGQSSLTDGDARLEAMDRMGIAVQVLAGWVDLTGYELGRDAALEYSRAHNEALAGEASRAETRFRSIGTAPLQFPDLAVTALEHAMKQLGMSGVQVATTVEGRFLDQVDGLDAFWEAAADLGAFVLLHPMRPLSGLDLTRYGMDNAVARPVETSVALAGLIMSGVLERYPGLVLCAVHGAGFLPYQIGRLDKAFRHAPDIAGARISKPPSEYLKMVHADTIVHNPQALAHLVAMLGVDRVMLGTDHPFPMGDQDPVALVTSTPGLGPEEVRAITSENARRLLG